MKTIQEVERWRAEARAAFDDPANVVCQLFVRYVEADHTPKQTSEYFNLFCFRDGQEIVVWLGPDLIIPLIISRDGSETDELGVLKFGADSISCGVWALTPSLNIPGVIHGFVILYDVPTPAPWERLIILPSEAA